MFPEYPPPRNERAAHGGPSSAAQSLPAGLHAPGCTHSGTVKPADSALAALMGHSYQALTLPTPPLHCVPAKKVLS